MAIPWIFKQSPVLSLRGPKDRGNDIFVGRATRRSPPPGFHDGNYFPSRLPSRMARITMPVTWALFSMAVGKMSADSALVSAAIT